MIQRGQMSFTVHLPDGQDVEDTHKAVEALFKERGVTVEGYSWADMNNQYDVIGLDSNGDPWEETIFAASEPEAKAQVPEGVTIAKIAAVSIFAATPGGS